MSKIRPPSPLKRMKTTPNGSEKVFKRQSVMQTFRHGCRKVFAYLHCNLNTIMVSIVIYIQLADI